MKKGGYRTALFSSNGYVSGKWGFDRGWDEIRNFIRESLPNGADYLWKTARPWMDAPANQGKPQFLYLATVEPHVIYNPKKEFLARYWKKPYKGPIKPATSAACSSATSSRASSRSTTPTRPTSRRCTTPRSPRATSLFGAFIADLKAAEPLRHLGDHRGLRSRRRVLGARRRRPRPGRVPGAGAHPAHHPGARASSRRAGWWRPTSRRWTCSRPCSTWRAAHPRGHPGQLAAAAGPGRDRPQPAGGAEPEPGDAPAGSRWPATASSTAAWGGSSCTTRSRIRGSRRTWPPATPSRCARCATCSDCCTPSRTAGASGPGARRPTSTMCSTARSAER